MIPIFFDQIFFLIAAEILTRVGADMGKKMLSLLIAGTQPS